MTKAGLLATVFATLLGATALAQEPIRIGAINPYSGPVALYGDEVARGYQLAIDEANAKGGVIGRKIELFRGDAGNPQQGIAAVEKLVSDKVDIFVGTYISAVSNAASDAATALQQDLLGHQCARRRPDRARPAELRAQRALCVELRRGVGERGARPDRAGARQADQGAEGVDRERRLRSTAPRSRSGRRNCWRRKARPSSASARITSAPPTSTNSVLRAKGAAPDVWINTGYVPDGNLLLRTMRDQGFKPAAILLVGTGDTFETLRCARRRVSRGHRGRRLSAPRPDRRLRPRRRRISCGLQEEVSSAIRSPRRA